MTNSEYNAKHKRFLTAMGAEGMKESIDFSGSQRGNANKGFATDTKTGLSSGNEADNR